MNIGTRSVLFGAHQFAIHPWFVALAWWRLYGFPFDPRLWIAFFVHDLGYIGKPNMDGPEGETHVEFGARLMGFLFGHEWHDFCLYHSRFYARKNGAQFSKLCVADKLATVLTPFWLYMPLVRLSGEVREYMTIAGRGKYQGEPTTIQERVKISTASIRTWHSAMVSYMHRWVEEHRDCRPDTWTPIHGTRREQNSNGVY